MIEKLARNPLALAAAFVLSALLGAALFAGMQTLMPGASRDKTQVEQIVRNYLLTHPEIIPEVVEKLQAKDAAKAAEAEQAAAKAVPAQLAALGTPYASAMAGNPQGDVTVVAFMDYACGYCRASLPGIEELVKRDPNVRIVYREYPVLGPASLVAARWALAAAEQGKFRPFHDALYAEGSPSETTIAAAAAKAGLDIAAARKAVGSKAVQDEIQANHKLGEKLAMSGTPSWVIGNQLIYGARDYDGLAAAVAAARKGK